MPKGPQGPVVVTYLQPDEPTPDAGGDNPWVIVEPFDRSGEFHGSGGAFGASGEWVGYASLVEDDVNFERALAAARAWAQKYNVPTIYVRTVPERTDA